MRTVALTLFAIGGFVFLIAIVYCIVDQMRTGVLFRNKKLMFPPIIVGWLIAVSGMITLALQQQQRMAEGTNWYLIVPLIIIILAVGITLAIRNGGRKTK